MNYYIIAGEVSGDLHGANLMKEIKRVDANAVIRCWGGDKMQAAGGKLVRHYRELAFMGFWEVLTNLSVILKNIAFCKKDIAEFQPEAIILIDYPGFNLRIAKFASRAGYKVIYYISPQVWAWHANRIKKIKKYVDRMYVILPFEQEFYRKWNYEVSFVGHPLLDAIAQKIPNHQFREENGLNDQPIIAILPGSRKQEILKMLPVMVQLATIYKDLQFVVGVVSHIDRSFYEQLVKGDNVKFLEDNTYDLLEQAEAAIVTSGTATLETALFDIPQVVCYKGNKLSFALGKWLVDVKFIALVNLIMDKEVVTELIQNDFTIDNLKNNLDKILFDKEVRKTMIDNYQQLKLKLGGEGASATTAQLIHQFLQKAS